MPKRPTAIRIDPGDYDKIEEKVKRGEAKDVSTYLRDAVREKLAENRMTLEFDLETVQGIRRLVEIGAYDSEEAFLKEAVQRLLYISKDNEMIREAVFKTFLDDPKFKDAMLKFIHEVFVEGFRPPPKP